MNSVPFGMQLFYYLCGEDRRRDDRQRSASIDLVAHRVFLAVDVPDVGVSLVEGSCIFVNYRPPGLTLVTSPVSAPSEHP